MGEWIDGFAVLTHGGPDSVDWRSNFESCRFRLGRDDGTNIYIDFDYVSIPVKQGTADTVIFFNADLEVVWRQRLAHLAKPGDEVSVG